MQKAISSWLLDFLLHLHAFIALKTICHINTNLDMLNCLCHFLRLLTICLHLRVQYVESFNIYN